MAHHIISVCIFCFICATHSPCASHAAIGHFEKYRHDGYKDPNIPKIEHNPELNLRQKRSSEYRIPDGYFNADQIAALQENGKGNRVLLKRSSDHGHNDLKSEFDFVKKIFLMFGDGNTMTIEEFGRLLRRLDLLQILSKKLHLHEEGDEEELSLVGIEKEVAVKRNETCFDKETTTILQRVTEPLNHTTFSEACPLLIYSLLAETCPTSEDKKDIFDVEIPKSPGVDGQRWLYSSLAVLLISVCGIGSLVIIPLMQKRFYKPLIQFLVALAVGTLAGDALLHLLPHAMGEAGHAHGHAHEEVDDGEDPHLQNTFKGLVAMLGLTFFFIMERLIMVAVKWRKKQQKHKTVPHAHVQIYDDQGERRHDTQCMDKYNTSPYCYKDIMTDPNTTFIEPDNSAMELLGSKPDLRMLNSRSPTLEKLETNRNVADADLISTPCIEARMFPHDHEDFTVIVREHANDHHGHSHKHGHVHAAPQNYSSVAWMVIMGDGLHNFTDGMAIGAAFASGMAGGFSTTVAVFCHELPHELGDFAMLLKAGMSIKQALFYNLLSSGLCILGNFVGLYLGNTESANQWVFAAAAGTFIYIALVDMIPELSSAHDDEDNLIQSFLHLSGLLIGVGIMTVIALYEHNLKNLFHDPQ